MKVIKEGKLPTKYSCKCPYCNTEFEFEDNEIKHSFFYPHNYIKCPVCNKQLGRLFWNRKD